jgi:hypothetical protein
MLSDIMVTFVDNIRRSRRFSVNFKEAPTLNFITIYKDFRSEFARVPHPVVHKKTQNPTKSQAHPPHRDLERGTPARVSFFCSAALETLLHFF